MPPGPKTFLPAFQRPEWDIAAGRGPLISTLTLNKHRFPGSRPVLPSPPNVQAPPSSPEQRLPTPATEAGRRRSILSSKSEASQCNCGTPAPYSDGANSRTTGRSRAGGQRVLLRPSCGATTKPAPNGLPAGDDTPAAHLRHRPSPQIRRYQGTEAHLRHESPPQRVQPAG